MPFRSLNIQKLQQACCRLIGSTVLLSVFHLSGASGFLPDGGESSLVGTLVADQTSPTVALGANGGYVVWHDEAFSEDGGGIRARRINRGPTGSAVGVFAPFWVNSKTHGLQDAPQAALLADGGAVFVWQAGPVGQQGIYARFLRGGSGATPSFLGDEVEVAPSGGALNGSPGVTRLTDGSVVVVWGHYVNSQSFQDVFAQRFTGSGQKVGEPFQVNLTTDYNQRSPAIAALDDGNFVVSWVSENQRFDHSVDIYGRVFSVSGFALTPNEMRLNYGTNICSTPALAALPHGGFAATVPQNGWDVYARSFDQGAVAASPSVRVNDYQFFDQLAPHLAVAGDTIMVVWSSAWQDGSREGVFGRYLSLDSQISDDEFELNQTVNSQQIQPAVASDGTSQFLSVWSAFASLDAGFDLVSRKFVGPAPLIAPACTLTQMSNGIKLGWNTEAGSDYQVQSSTDMQNWTAVGTARTATEATDSLMLQPAQGGTFFRIIRLH